MKRLILSLALGLVAACDDPSNPSTSDATAPTALATADENFDCVGTASGQFANVFVPAGETCSVENSTVSGSVLARERSRLFVSNTRVPGNIDGVEARVVQVRGGSLGGSIQIADGSSAGETGAAVFGGTVLSQGNIQILKMRTGTIRIADVVLRKGNIILQQNVVGSSSRSSATAWLRIFRCSRTRGPGPSKCATIPWPRLWSARRTPLHSWAARTRRVKRRSNASSTRSDRRESRRPRRVVEAVLLRALRAEA